MLSIRAAFHDVVDTLQAQSAIAGPSEDALKAEIIRRLLDLVAHGTTYPRAKGSSARKSAATVERQPGLTNLQASISPQAFGAAGTICNSALIVAPRCSRSAGLESLAFFSVAAHSHAPPLALGRAVKASATFS